MILLAYGTMWRELVLVRSLVNNNHAPACVHRSPAVTASTSWRPMLIRARASACAGYDDMFHFTKQSLNRVAFNDAGRRVTRVRTLLRPFTPLDLSKPVACAPCDRSALRSRTAFLLFLSGGVSGDAARIVATPPPCCSSDMTPAPHASLIPTQNLISQNLLSSSKLPPRVQKPGGLVLGYHTRTREGDF